MPKRAEINTRDLSYVYYRPQHPKALGSPRLDIVIYDAPTKRYYDPNQVNLTIISRRGTLQSLTVRHPWPCGREYRVAAGRVTLSDRESEKVQAFSFGGSLRIQSQLANTTCSLESPAPILRVGRADYPIIRLGRAHDFETLLAVEVEVELAKRRAARLPDLDVYENRLAAADPLTLYAACLRTLREKFEHFPLREMHNDFADFLRSEMRTLHRAGLGPSRVIELDDLV